MDKVQPNNPATQRVPATVATAKAGSPGEANKSNSQGTHAPNANNSPNATGKSLPANASKGLEAAAAADRQQVEAAANKVNEYAKQQQREVRFSVDQELGRPVVKVVDSSRDVVIRQIPSEVVIRLARNLEEYMEYSELSGATEPADSELPAGASSAGEASGLAKGIEPGHLINTTV